MHRLRWLSPMLACWLAACSVVDFGRPGETDPEARYAAAYPSYAEFCALSQIKKKPGFGAEIRGEIGGHAVFYLNGACRSSDGDQQVLRPCDDPAAEAGDGVGISMNEHFRSAKWVAIPGRGLFYDGGLPEGAGLTRDRYRATQAEARRRRLYEDIEFHPRFFETMPPDMSAEDYKYEISIATDYAISLGRGRYCARVPVTRPQLVAMIDFLNAENAPYRSGRAAFRWSLFQDNCIHLAHNALAAAAMWEPWPTHRSLLVSILDFPVPKNEFVNLMRRANDAALLEPLDVWRDPVARQSVLRFGQLPVRPGAIALSWPARTPNEVYETALKLVFYDEPIIGRYRGRLEDILVDPRQFDLDRNLAGLAERYRRLRSGRLPLDQWLAQSDPAAAEPDVAATFHRRFYAALDRAILEADRNLTGLRADRLRSPVPDRTAR